ncbi:MAG TPA: hypothetical protein VII75_12470, partial [Thermoanaerobaculia bacterium]
MKRITILLLAILLIPAGSALAYDPTLVHPSMAKHALINAKTQRDFLKPLGLSDSKTYDGKLLSAWLAAGAHDEDGLLPFPRSLNHFYDPVHDKQLRHRFFPFFCFYTPLGERAPNWGTNSTLNVYDVANAKQEYLTSLTAQTPDLRDKSTAKLFLDLGHIVHLIQDMAQPEHTRNDQHMYGESPLEPGSIYELFTQRILDKGYNGITPDQMQPILLDGYTIVALPDYRDYFVTADRRGMSDYSNNNFVTQDTNFNAVDRECDDDNFLLPSLNDATVTPNATVKIEEVLVPPFFNTKATIPVAYFTWKHDVLDNYTLGTDQQHILTRQSFLDFETKKYLVKDAAGNPLTIYSLDEDSFFDQAKLLMPRAVGYSGGMLDHFFRGSIEAKWKKNGSDNAFIVSIKNKTAEAIDNAKVKFYVRVQDGTIDNLELGYDADLFHLGAAGSSDDSIDIPITIGGIALPAGQQILRCERRVVITGKLGVEQNAIIGLVQPPEADKILIATLAGLKLVATDGSSSQLIWPAPINLNPFFAPGTFNAGPYYAPDGHSIAALLKVNHRDAVAVATTIPPVSFDTLMPPNPNNYIYQIVGAPLWNATATQLAYWITYSCAGPNCPFGFKEGVMVVDTTTGAGSFHDFSDPNAEWRSATILGSTAWSGNGRYFEYTGYRFDLFTNTFAKAPAVGGTRSFDGTKAYFPSSTSALTAPISDLMEYDFTTGTTQLLFAHNADYFVSPANRILVSPDGTKLAFEYRANNPNNPVLHKMMIY